MTRMFICSPSTPMTSTVQNVVDDIRPRFRISKYKLTIDQSGLPTHNPVGHPALVMGVRCEPVPVKTVVPPIPPPVRSVFYEPTRGKGRARGRRRDDLGKGGFTPVVGSLALPRPVKAEPVIEENQLIDFLDTDIPDIIQKEACLRPVTEDTLERDQIFQSMSNTPSLEGVTCVLSDSAVVSPLQSLESSRVTSLPCPERPWEPRRAYHSQVVFCQHCLVSLHPHSPGWGIRWSADPPR